jgi:surface antigen
MAAVLASSTVISGCASDGSLTPEGKQLLGTLAGATVGLAACKLAHANDTQCALLMLAGGTAGYLIAKNLDPRDKRPRQQAVDTMLAPTPQKNSSWKSADTGNSGNLKLLSKTSNAQGQECRQMRESYSKAGTPTPIVETYTMCKGDNGQWETMN